jgi:hypothetical protein
MPRTRWAGSFGIGARAGVGGNPRATLFGFDTCEDANFAWDKETHRFNRVSHPTNIRDNRDALTARGVLEPEIEVVPCSARKP